MPLIHPRTVVQETATKIVDSHCMTVKFKYFVVMSHIFLSIDDTVRKYTITNNPNEKVDCSSIFRRTEFENDYQPEFMQKSYGK